MTGHPPGVVRLAVPASLAGERLDRFVAAATDLSRRAARRLAAEGRLWRNGRPSRVLSRTLETGDVVELLVEPGTVRTTLEPPPPVDLLHEDGWIVAVDKPAGVLSQASGTMPEDEHPADERLLLQLALAAGRRPYLRLVHRLDRLTSGVLLFARQPAAMGPLSRAWASGTVLRLYLAIVRGRMAPEPLVVDKPISRDPAHTWRFRTHAGGRVAVTRIRPLLPGPGDTTVVVCRPLTGRTHQVRVHLAAAGHPVLGDRLYGGGTAEVPRPMLHAAFLELPHPGTGERLGIAAPVPDDMTDRLPGEFRDPEWRTSLGGDT